MIIIILFFHIWRLCLTLKTLGVEKTNTMLTLLIHIFLNIYILFYFFQIFFCFLSSSILTIIFRMKNVLILFSNKNCVIDMNSNLFVYKLLCDIYFKSLFFFLKKNSDWEISWDRWRHCHRNNRVDRWRTNQ